MNIFLKNKKNIQGSALISVIIFITIILLFIAIILLYQRNQIRQMISFGNEIQVYMNLQSMLPGVLNEYNNLLADGNFSIKTWQESLFEKDATEALMQPYGFYLLCRVSSRIKNIGRESTYLIGDNSRELYRYAMVTGDVYMPVVVTGNTSITGDVSVGRQGIKAGVLKGVRYKGSQVVYGRVFREDVSILPDNNLAMIKPQLEYLEQISGEAAAFGDPDMFKISGNRLFLNNGVYVLDEADIYALRNAGITEIYGPGTFILPTSTTLEGISLFGQITLFSRENLIISSGVHTENILVFAEDILISGANELCGQFIAFDSLSVESESYIKYPSVVALVENKPWLKKRTITIGSGARVEGTVILCEKEPQPGRRSEHKMIISQSAAITGLAYSSNFAELTGSITGGIFVSAFNFYLSPTIYINWLKDARIDRTRLSNEFIYPLLFKKPYKLTMVQKI